MTSAQAADARVQEASAARSRGDFERARQLLEKALREAPASARVLNLLGLVLLDLRDAAGARHRFEQAIELDPASPLLWLNIAQSDRLGGRIDEQIGALDRALALDPYMIAAIAQKADALEESGRGAEALPLYAGLLQLVPAGAQLPAALRAVVDRGEARLRAAADTREAGASAEIERVRRDYGADALSRANVFADIHYGRRRIYYPQPTGSQFPFLPSDEYFDRGHFPWFARLEEATDIISAELDRLLARDRDKFAPYVQLPAGTPLNQWRELQNSSRWDSYFLWRDGQAVNEALESCPATAALLETLPLLDVRGRGPTVMFSVLAPGTTIPPHSGTTNIRATVHLPLIVPEGCLFRVGGETREWARGTAWAFDDTIEHEACNPSAEPRVILILDTWNPHLSEAERAMIRAVNR